MNRKWIVGTTIVVVGAIAAAGAIAAVKGREKGNEAGAPKFEPFEAAQIVEAGVMTFQPTADMVGTVFAKRSVMVRNELAARVLEVGFDSGVVVEAGQVLVRQDDTTDRADLEAALASVRVAEASIEQGDTEIALAEVELQRLSAVQTRAIAEVELDRARSRLDAARAARVRWVAEADQARARVAQVESRIEKLTIRAPFRARAGMRTVHEGQYLAEGTDIVGLQELTDTIYLDFAVPQEYAERARVGTVVMASGAMLGSEPARIEVVAVDATVNNSTRNLRIRAIVDNSRGALVPGMFVQVRVPIDAPSEHVVVPSVAIRRAPYGNSVFVISADESGETRAFQRFVTLGETVGEQVIVLDGLKQGERIAAAGSFKLRDGVKVVTGEPGGGPGGGAEGGDRAGGPSPASGGATKADGQSGPEKS
ncbi:MAG: efflux RND transporter periplasmic adaptor subunit [Phycisphaeraceae bacterium]|nr:MAG: efflux RND transporter periplasmic adaptor subunit [Phycisphaeraceae bacterium]